MLSMIFGEKSITKLAGIFKSKSEAQRLASRALELPSVHPAQVHVLGPHHARADHADLFGRKMQPEQRGIVLTLIRTHTAAGVVGAALGAALYAFLLSSGQPMVAASPVLSGLAITTFCSIFAMMVGGLVALRPDHAQLITAVRSALRRGRWVVVVHPVGADQVVRMHQMLQSSPAHVLRTL